MSDHEEINTLRHRVTTLEEEVRTIRSQLGDFREIISHGFGVLFDANTDRSHSIQHHARLIEDIEERLDPAFNKAFPQHAEFVREAQAIFTSSRKGAS